MFLLCELHKALMVSKIKKVLYKYQLICKIKNELRVSSKCPPPQIPYCVTEFQIPQILYCLKCPVRAGVPGIGKSWKTEGPMS